MLMYTGTGWVETSHAVPDATPLVKGIDTRKWDRTGTVLSPATAGDVVNISAGTAALPGLTPVGDPNTGIYSPGAGQVAVSTGGAGRVFVDASGNVGIGSTSPGSALEVNAAAATSPFIAKINTAEVARIDSNGRLGININTPGYLLHFGGQSIAAPTGQIAFGNTLGTTPTARIDGYRVDGSYAGELHFYTTERGGTQTRAVTIDSKASLLVGTSTHEGSVSNIAPVVAGQFYSFTGYSSSVSGTAVTMFAPPNVDATYMVVARISNANDAASYEAVSLLSANAGASVSLALTPLKTGGSMSITLSGADLQVTQVSGNVATIAWVVTRIG
jgi:hypothetical protein